jgi:hypothetical protein
LKHKQHLVRILKLAWLLICFYIGIIHFSDGRFSEGYAATLTVMMSMVTFPIGYLAVYLLKTLVWIFAKPIYTDVIGSLNFSIWLWVWMTSLGYFQWFYLVPKILALAKKR